MNLPYNTTIAGQKGTFYVNLDNSFTAKVEKMYIVNQAVGATELSLWIENEGREAMLLKTVIPVGAMVEFVGPLYLNKGDKIIGKTSETGTTVSVSIQGIMIKK